ncbi:alpha-tocopherol transfer protein-like [Thrips palmi]|uniref:Alpha-tocopherol transfer protein-like n=1 Tax=Thrips palmi TaxID=161013 RepID=A0A6P9A1U1_THRPL|nr:alpha-tocopherol transfer protein-like [Thrips palmi]XP_034251396.1 alpha-tocopherol transfer protein-like [Thrips palmi]
MPNAVQIDVVVPFDGEMTPEDYKDLLNEIGATPESLSRDAVTLREWCNAQPHLPTLTCEHHKWLEKFMVGSKNSMEKAKLRLDNYFKTRNLLEDWFVLPQSEEEQLRYVGRFMHLGIIPKILPGGNILFVEKLIPSCDRDWSHFDFGKRYQIGVMLFELTLAVDRKARGLVYVIDVESLSVDWVTNFLASIGKVRKFLSCLQDTMPTRIQAVHVVNAIAPSILRTCLNMITPMLKDKLAQRIFIHDNLESLHDAVPPEYLPKSFGGTSAISMEELSDSTMDLICGCREWFESRAWMKSDEQRRPNTTVAAYGVEGSFRKLAVD